MAVRHQPTTAQSRLIAPEGFTTATACQTLNGRQDHDQLVQRRVERLPDQQRDPDDDRVRVQGIGSPNPSPYGEAWVFWDDWETENQRALREALGGWIGCEEMPSQ